MSQWANFSLLWYLNLIGTVIFVYRLYIGRIVQIHSVRDAQDALQDENVAVRISVAETSPEKSSWHLIYARRRLLSEKVQVRFTRVVADVRQESPHISYQGQRFRAGQGGEGPCIIPTTRPARLLPLCHIFVKTLALGILQGAKVALS